MDSKIIALESMELKLLAKTMKLMMSRQEEQEEEE